MARTKRTPRKSTGGLAPRKQGATRASRRWNSIPDANGASKKLKMYFPPFQPESTAWAGRIFCMTDQIFLHRIGRDFTCFYFPSTRIKSPTNQFLVHHAVFCASAMQNPAPHAMSGSHCATPPAHADFDLPHSQLHVPTGLMCRPCK